MVRPGVATQEIDAEVERVIRTHGATPEFKGYHGYPAASCISVNDQVVHGIPGHRRLADGDIVGIDFGCFKDGYCGDSARTVPIGNVTPEAQRLMEVTRQSLDRAIEKCVPGNRLEDIGWAVQEHVEENGFSVVRKFVGHGIGKAMHEDPPVPNIGRAGVGQRLRTGNVLAIEPMVNAGSAATRLLDDGWSVVTADGSRSAHVEHTVAITDDGPEILTRP